MRLSNSTLKLISERCPNLERFDFRSVESIYAGPGSGRHEIFTEIGLIHLLHCTKLKSLYLDIDCRDNVGLAAFEYILNPSVNLDRLLVVGCGELMANKTLCAELAAKLSFFEVITVQEYNERINSLRTRGEASVVEI